MKAIITGAAGLVGGYLTEKLLEQNYEVFAIDRFRSRRTNISNYFPKNTEI